MSLKFPELQFLYLKIRINNTSSTCLTGEDKQEGLLSWRVLPHSCGVFSDDQMLPFLPPHAPPQPAPISAGCRKCAEGGRLHSNASAIHPPSAKAFGSICDVGTVGPIPHPQDSQRRTSSLIWFSVFPRSRAVIVNVLPSKHTSTFNAHFSTNSTPDSVAFGITQL